MAFSSWLCSNNAKNMIVKIVHPGGRVELHDRPVLAAEIIFRNPRCIVAHPHVFQQPWAIVEPETMLMPGQKFYVVPISTIRKLQRLSFKYNSPPPVHDIRSIKSFKDEEKDDNKSSTTCWKFFMNKNNLIPYSCLKHTDNEGEKANTGSNARRDGCFSDDTCFLCLLTGIKIKGNGTDSGEESRPSSSFGSSETKGLTRKRTSDFTRGSPKRYSSIDHWRPNLESITEEQTN